MKESWEDMIKFIEVVAVLAVLAACATAFALYRGWFSIWGRAGSPWSDKLKVGVTVDRGKAKRDAQKVKNASEALRR